MLSVDSHASVSGCGTGHTPGDGATGKHLQCKLVFRTIPLQFVRFIIQLYQPSGLNFQVNFLIN